MAKMRGIKPEFWTDENIVELSIEARLLFIGLWTHACDNGHLQDKPRQIKMRVYPGDDVRVDDLLNEIRDAGLIERADGWISIPNLTEHQKPDRRYFKICTRDDCNEPDETTSQRESRRAHAVRTTGARRANTVRTEGARAEGDGEGDGEGVSEGDGARASTPSTRARKRAHQLPTDWEPNDGHRTYAAEAGLSLAAEVAQFTDHHRAKGSTMKDWDAAFRTWLRNAIKWRRNEPTRPGIRALPEAATLELPPDGLSPEEYAAWHRDRRERLRA